MEEKDIRETGVQGLRFDANRGLGSQVEGSDPFASMRYRSGKNIAGLSDIYSSSPKEYVGEQLASMGYGNSQYDKGITDMWEAQNINEYRAQAQPWYDQIANGALKMVSTAATTFIDGTLGALWGLGTGITNWFDDDPSTGFWRGMWDNAVSNAMADVNDKVEEAAKNYRSEWEENASVFQRMFSSQGAANFWGDDILKNAGFTIGAAASIYATSSVGGALKGAPGLSRIGRGVGLLTKGDQGLEVTGAGKVASWLTKTFASTQGEAAIESLNAIRQSEKDMNLNLENRKAERQQDAEIEYMLNLNEGMNPVEAQSIYNDRLNQIEADAEAYKKQMQMELAKAGNMIYAANIAALSVSNNLTLGSMIRGGYGNSKSLLKQAIKTTEGKPITTAEEAGEALLKGTLRFDAPEVENRLAKTLGHWALTSTQEGLEEGVQNLASNTGQIRTAAIMNKWAKDNTMLGTMLNPDATEDLIDYSKALGKAYEDQFGSINSPGWTEVVAGFITGAVGTVSAHRNDAGNIRPTWQGGLKESWETVNGNREAVQKQAEALNNALTSNKFNDRVRHTVQQIAIRKAQEDALGRGDTQAFKNLEVQHLLGDAVFFRNIGMLDDYLAMYKAMADGITDQDVAELKAAAKEEDGKPSALESMTDDDIKALYQDKARSTLDKINEALDNYKTIEDNYGDKFSDETRNEAIMEMTYLNTLSWDTYRRIDEIGKEISDLQNKEGRTPLEDTKLAQLKVAESDLIKQAKEIKETLNEYQSDPKKLQDKVEKVQLDRQKVELYKQTDKAIAKYQEATTLQDIVDVYSHSPEEDREAVLTQAIEQTEGETKEKLQQFKNYVGDVTTLEHVIEDRFPIADNPTENIQKQVVFKNILNAIVNEMLSDETPIINRDTLKDKLKERLAEMEETRDNESLEAQGVVVNSDGTIDFSKAIEAGVIDEDSEDFEDVLDDVDTGESHRVIKEGSNADRMAIAAQRVAGISSMIEDMNYFIDSLDKLDELREATKKKKEADKKTKEKKEKKEKAEAKEVKGKHSTFTEEVIEGDVESGEDKDSFSMDDLDDDEAPEEAPEETEGAAEESEEEEDKSKLDKKSKKTKPSLSPELSAYYNIAPKEGESGVTYYSVSRKSKKVETPDKIKKKIMRLSDKSNYYLNELIGEFNKAKSDEAKRKTMNEILSLINSSIVSNSVIKTAENFLKKNSSYLKPDSSEEAALPPHSNEEEPALADSQTSMNGNQSPAYVSSKLSSKFEKVVKYTRGVVQTWLEDQGFNIQEIIDNYLGKVVERDSSKAIKDRTPIYYLHNSEQENAIFLAVRYSDVESIIPRDKAKKVVKGQDGETYLLVGTLGYDEAYRKGTKDMYFTVLNNLKGESHTPEGWSVDTEHTNRIKDITPGDTVKQAIGDYKSADKDNLNETKHRSLDELLNDPNRNPYNLRLEDLSWTVIEGNKEDGLKRKVINGDPSKIYGIKGGEPGQVYLNIPASNGKFIPIYMETLFLDELAEDTPLMDEIKRLVGILADQSNTMQDKKSAIANLKDLLLFSKGINQIHLNDEKNKVDSNTIYITRNGEALKIIDFKEGTGTAQDLLDAIVSINPRINISTSQLDRDPQIYLDSGVLITDRAILGTVNSKFYVFPVNSEGEYVENKPFKGTGKTYDASTRSMIIVGGRKVYYDGRAFTNQDGSSVEEDETFKIALRIKQGKVEPIKLGKEKSERTYYDVDGVMYMDNGHGGLNILDDELREEVLEANEKKGKSGRRKERVKKRAKEIEKEHLDSLPEAPKGAEESDTLLDWDESSESSKSEDGKVERKPDDEAERPDTKGKTNFTNGTDIDSIKSQEELDAQRDSTSLSTTLKARANKAKKEDLYAAITEKFGKRPENNAEAIETLIGHNIDISSNDLETIAGLVRCYH